MLERLDIRDKLLLVLWGTALAVALLGAVTLALFQRLTLEQRAREAMEPYARLVAVGTEPAVAFEDSARAQEVLGTLAANTAILEALVVLEDDRVLARFSRVQGVSAHELSRRQAGVTLQRDTAELQSPLTHGAWLHLVASRDLFEDRQGRQRLWLYLAGAVGLLFVTLAQTLVLRRAIVRPVAALTDAAEGIRLKADYQRSVPATGTDEVARLARSFNAMLEAVRVREQDLQRLSLFRRTVLEGAAHGIISTTPDGVVTSFNAAAERLLGYRAEEVVGLTTPILWHLPEEVSERARALSRELGEVVSPGFEVFVARARRGLRSERDWTYVRKDGSRVPVLLTVTALRDDGGGLTGFVGLVTDLTERRQAEQQRLAHIHFLESMDRLNLALTRTNELEAMMSGVLDVALEVFPCEGAFLASPCDPEAATWRVAMERTASGVALAFVPGEERTMDPRTAQALQLVLASDGPVAFGPGAAPDAGPTGLPEGWGLSSLLCVALRPKVGLPWLLALRRRAEAGPWTGEEQRLFQEAGRRLGDGLTTLLAFRDLRESTAKLEETQRIAHIGYWDRDDAKGTIELSQESCRILALAEDRRVLDLDEWHGRWLELLHPEDRPAAEAALAAALQGEAPYDVEYRVVLPSGVTRHLHSEGVVSRLAPGRGPRMLGMLQDITERKAAEEEVHRLNQVLEARVRERTAQLEAANQELEAFAFSVSHDLRAPLRHVDGFTGLLSRKLGERLDEQSRHYMTAIVDATKRMEQLIDDLLSFSRMGRKEMARQQVDLGVVVREVLKELEPETKGREVRWTVAEFPSVEGDKAMLRGVMANLLLNALKFTRPRAVADIEIGVKVSPVEVEVFVRDNGVGFDMRSADRLFGVFQRLHRADEFEGTGIGLANVRRVVARHGGRTWAEGKVDAGATFHFTLPRSAYQGGQP